MRTPHLLAIFALALALAPAARADWIWTKEDGWVNTKYAGRETVGPQFQQAKALFDAGDHAGAARAFQRILDAGVVGKLREDTLFYAAESSFEAGNYYQAHVHYEMLLGEYPATSRIRRVAEREYRIGQALIRGEKKEFLVLFRVSSEEEGVRILRRILERYPTGDFADDAHFTIANYYYQDGRYLEAMEEYKVLREREEFQTSEWRQVALYQIARCQEAEYQGPVYDTSPIAESSKTYAQYEKEDPSGSRVSDARARRADVEDDLAEADYLRAQWYVQWGRPAAAAIYLYDVLELHPDTVWAEKARKLLSELEVEEVARESRRGDNP